MIVRTEEQYAEALTWFDGELIALDVETVPFNPKNKQVHAWQLPLIGVGLADSKHKVFILAELLDERFQRLLDTQRFVLHNAKFDLTVIGEKFDVSKVRFDDTMLLAWLLDENRQSFGLKQLTHELLGGEPPKKFKDLAKMPASRDAPEWEGWIDELGTYCEADCTNTLALYNLFWPQLSKEFQREYERLELPIVRVLMKMERRGVKLDTEYLLDMQKRIAVETKELKERLEVVLKDVNLNSPVQLRKFLYDERGFKVPEQYYTDSGKPSTNAEALEYLEKTYQEPWLKDLLRYREVQKIDTTYVTGLLEAQVDSVVYGSLHQVGTVTGRFSSSNPNLQNIPRGDSGFDIRRAFVARPGHTFVISDYSQIELRLMAFFSGDEVMIQAYADDKDIHQATADLLKCTRTYAKTVNFGISYGKTPFGLAQDLNITKEEATAFIDNYFHQFPKVKSFMDGATRQLRLLGFTETLTKRKRRFPEYREAMLKGWGSAVHRMERQAGNSIIQGSAADLMKIAMRNLTDKLPEHDSHILLTIHDELIVEVPEGKAEEMKALVQHEMESAVNLKTVSLKAEPKISPVWVK